jgi:hypothetical protein
MDRWLVRCLFHEGPLGRSARRSLILTLLYRENSVIAVRDKSSVLDRDRAIVVRHRGGVDVGKTILV